MYMCICMCVCVCTYILHVLSAYVLSLTFKMDIAIEVRCNTL